MLTGAVKMKLFSLELLSLNSDEITGLEILLNRMTIIDFTDYAAVRVVQYQRFEIRINRARQVYGRLVPALAAHKIVSRQVSSLLWTVFT